MKLLIVKTLFIQFEYYFKEYISNYKTAVKKLYTHAWSQEGIIKVVSTKQEENESTSISDINLRNVSNRSARNFFKKWFENFKISSRTL